MSVELLDDERTALREVATTCLCRKARVAARTLTRFYDRHFGESGIEPTQFNILVAIRLTEPVSMIRLADILGLERTTLTRNLALLQRDGLVTTARGKDARQRLHSLTATGRQVLKKALPRWKRAQQAAISVLGQEDFARISEGLSLSNKFIQPQTKYEN
jgi:DNA-binding MarR family transcriptional regulator